jgi:DNA repair exonuclease SbcCD ATPase subunit
MRLKKARFVNYCQYADRTFTFDQGLTVITGSNGKGKSNFLNGLFFCSTGSTLIEKKTRPKMLKWKTDKGYVHVWYEMGGIDYDVKRNLHNGSARMEWTEGTDRKVLTTTPEINAKMEGLLHTDADTLALSSFMPQKGALALIFGTDIERQKEYSRLFKLAHLAKHRETIREIYNSIEVYPDFTEELKRLKTQLEGLKTEESTHQSGLDTSEKDIAVKRPIYDDYRKPRLGPSEQDQRLYGKLTQGRQIQDALKVSEVWFAANTQPVEPKWDSKKDDDLQEFRNQYSALLKQIDLVRHKRCPTCGSDVAVSKDEETRMGADLDVLADKIDLLQKERSKFKADYDAYAKADKEYTYQTKRIWDMSNQVGQISKEVKDFDEAAFLAKGKPAELTREQQNFISDFDHRVEHLNWLRERIAVCGASIKLVEKQVKEKETYMEMRKLAEKQKSFLDEMRRVLHVDVFPKEVISEYRPKLAQFVNKYLSIFRQPFYVNISPELACVCKFADNPNGTVDDLSGGQGVLLTICFRMAIVELLAGSTNIIVLDEPTPHLDSDNRAILADAFTKVKQYLSTHGIQMLVSTHEMELLTVADGEIRI